MVEAVRNFLKTEKAKALGFDSVADVTTAAVRELLEKYGYYEKIPAKARE
jgi:hypothetical protein